MKTKLFLNCIILTLALISSSCSKNNPLNPLGDCGALGWTQSVQKELNDFATAASNYSSDASEANCTSYKTAGKNYLDALEGVRTCVGTNKKAFDDAISDAKKDIDELDCD